eukprot:Awhi_evm1s7130
MIYYLFTYSFIHNQDENESDNVINNDDDDEADPDEDENEEGGLNFGLPMFFDGPNEDGSLEGAFCYFSPRCKYLHA